MVKKRVLCIIDVYNWAMHNRVSALRKFYGKSFEFDIILSKDLTKDSMDEYDVVYSLNWILHKHLGQYISKDRDYKLVTTICSHPNREKKRELLRVIKNYDAVSVSSKILRAEMKPIRKDIIYTPFGVDDTVFKKKTEPALYRREAGFVGKTNRPLKRFEVIRAASARCRVKLKIANHVSNYSRSEMVNFYNSIGFLLCYSESEGTPNPVLEAAACGRPVVASPVGNVPELFGSRYPIKTVRSRRELEDAIVRLTRDRGLSKACSDYLAGQVKNRWSWKYRVKPFGRLFL